jgi:hypothetical protein
MPRKRDKEKRLDSEKKILQLGQRKEIVEQKVIQNWKERLLHILFKIPSDIIFLIIEYTIDHKDWIITVGYIKYSNAVLLAFPASQPDGSLMIVKLFPNVSEIILDAVSQNVYIPLYNRFFPIDMLLGENYEKKMKEMIDQIKLDEFVTPNGNVWSFVLRRNNLWLCSSSGNFIHVKKFPKFIYNFSFVEVQDEFIIVDTSTSQGIIYLAEPFEYIKIDDLKEKKRTKMPSRKWQLFLSTLSSRTREVLSKVYTPHLPFHNITMLRNSSYIPTQKRWNEIDLLDSLFSTLGRPR